MSAGTITVLTDFSVKYGGSDVQRRHWSEQLAAVRASDIVNGRVLRAATPDPGVLWQEIDVIISNRDRDPLERFQHACAVVRANELDATQILRERVDASCKTLLTQALHTARYHVVEFVLEWLTVEEKKRLINLNLPGESWEVLDAPLYIASGLRDPCAPALIDLLIAHGADSRMPNTGIYGAEYPIHNAAQYGTLAALEELWSLNPDHLHAVRQSQGGRDRRSSLENGMTPLFGAISANDAAKVAFCIDKGADVHHRAESGMTPILLASLLGNSEVLPLLAPHIKNVNEAIPDGYYGAFFGNTALAQAMYENRYFAIGLLLARGADFERCHIEGRPALDRLTNPYPQQRNFAHFITGALVSESYRRKWSAPGFEQGAVRHLNTLIERARGFEPEDVALTMRLAERFLDPRTEAAEIVAIDLLFRALAARIDGESWRIEPRDVSVIVHSMTEQLERFRDIRERSDMAAENMRQAAVNALTGFQDVSAPKVGAALRELLRADADLFFFPITGTARFIGGLFRDNPPAEADYTT